MIGELTSVKDGPERNVKLVVCPTEVFSEISSPSDSYQPETIDHYEVCGVNELPERLATLTFILSDQRRILFYSTYSSFDMALLLDQLDGTIGVKRRVILRSS